MHTFPQGLQAQAKEFNIDPLMCEAMAVDNDNKEMYSDDEDDMYYES